MVSCLGLCAPGEPGERPEPHRPTGPFRGQGDRRACRLFGDLHLRHMMGQSAAPDLDVQLHGLAGPPARESCLDDQRKGNVSGKLERALHPTESPPLGRDPSAAGAGRAVRDANASSVSRSISSPGTWGAAWAPCLEVQLGDLPLRPAPGARLKDQRKRNVPGEFPRALRPTENAPGVEGALDRGGSLRCLRHGRPCGSRRDLIHLSGEATAWTHGSAGELRDLSVPGPDE
jgi:hypothetical protein